VTDILYRARAVTYAVHDGDTCVSCVLDLGWGTRISKSPLWNGALRLTSRGGPVNAPEVTGDEKAAGLVVLRHVAQLLAGEPFWIETPSLARDSRGRIPSNWLLPDGADLGQELLQTGWVKRGEPDGKRIPFTGAEIAAIVARR
jgi:hypothetical protein